ncbi:hypothetical protein HHK36_022497 [Tetracentron sinense]|uniref:Uncharacterized protein n=1 Tax=Tetracentron sinense TaxID=13715 RepID=A0A834YR42_TETSI|nr:hypothetical protein HHK36_022497 [Tetracentron sinense]
MRSKNLMKEQIIGIRRRLGKIMKRFWSGKQLRADEMVASSESLATRDYSASGYSSRAGESEQKADADYIEEAESSLRESSFLKYEEARALLGRLEYQKGNIEAALHLFEGIDISAVTPMMKLSIGRRCERRKHNYQSDEAPPMSMHAVSLLFEAFFLQAKSLQKLGRFREAAQSCKVILDTVESALPEGLPENFGADFKLQETLNKALELLPELWKLSDSPHEAILSYRWALLYHWNLDMETVARIQKEFALFLLYSGCNVSPPNLRSQIEGSFVPRNNIEEAVLLLLILLRKFLLKRIEWDPSIIDHLCFALSVSGELKALANQVEELLPEVMDRKERYHTLALCYYGEGEDLVALNLLRKLLSIRDNPNCILDLLLASKICGEKPNCAEEGIGFARKALASLQGGCDQMGSVANCLLGVSLSAQSRSVVSDSERIVRQSEALEALENADRMMRERDPKVVFHLSLENAEQRKLDVALNYAKELLKLEGGSNIKGWILLARILSAQKRFVDAETIINVALDQIGKWDQGELLRTKAKLQIAQGQLTNAIQTYTRLLDVLQVQNKSFGAGKKPLKGSGNHDRSLEMETWLALANVRTSLSQWRDAEGLCKEALKAFGNALDVEPTHVPSLISAATVLRQFGNQSLVVVRSFLADALRLDRTNPSAWYNLGLLYKAEGVASTLEAAECFEAAALLEECAPVEPFR